MQWKEKWVGKSTTWWTSKTIKKKVVSLLWRNPSKLAIWSLSFHGQIMCINSFWNVYRVRKKNHTKVFYQNFIKHTGYDKKIYTKVLLTILYKIYRVWQKIHTKVLGDGLDDASGSPLPFLGEGRDLDGVHCVGGQVLELVPVLSTGDHRLVFLL